MTGSQQFEINGLRAASVVIRAVQSNGMSVLLLHGWGANKELMLPVGELLGKLGYDCYILDLPGFGETDSPADVWSVHDYAKFVHCYLDYENMREFHLIGHSFGGRLGIILGAEFSADKLRKLVLVDSAGVLPKHPIAKTARLAGYKAIRGGLTKLGAKSSAEALRNWYAKRYGSADYQSAGNLRQTFVRIVNEDLLPYAAKISMPTLLIWGENDEDTPLWQGQALEKTIPDAGLVILKNAGHYSYLDRPSEFITIVDHFFRH